MAALSDAATRPRPRPAGRVVPALAAAWLALPVAAGPIPLGELPTAAATTTPTLDAMATQGGASAVAGDARQRSPGAVAAAPTPVVERPAPRPAVDAANEPVGGPGPPALRGVGPVGGNATTPAPMRDRRVESAPADADFGEARSKAKELAAAALDWVHDVLPWSRTAPPGAMPADAAVVGGDDVALPVQLDEEGRSGAAADRPGETGRGAIDPANPASALPFAGAPERRHSADPAASEVAIRDALALVRLVVGHPLTWLVVLLIGIAQFVVSRAGRGKP